jgi:pimeloyl-ACP methyl ester carboxylesterase
MNRTVPSIALVLAVLATLASCGTASHEATETRRVLELGADPVFLVSHEGASIQAFMIGNPAAPHRILFVHGWAATGAEFLDLARRVVEKRPDILCACVDLPGSGSSDKPAGVPWDVPYFRSVLRDVVGATRTYGLEAGTISDGVTLVGHSLGGHFCIDYAVRDGYGVARLGLISPAGWPGEIGPVSAWATRSNVTLDLVPSLINEETYVRGHRVMMGLGGAVYSEDAVRYSGRVLEQPEAKAALKAVTLNALEHDCIDGLLDSITVPVFLAWGRNDLILPFSYAEKFMSRLPPGTRFIPFDGCGHMPHFEHVEELSSLLTGFIDP